MTAPVGDFRMAGAYVELTIRDNTKADEEKVRRRIEDEPAVKLPTTLGDIPESDYTKQREKTKRQPPVELPVKAQDPIDEAWKAKIQASIKSISADAIKIPMSPDTAKYREELQLAVGELSSAVKQKIPVDLDQADQFKLHVEELAKQVQEEVKAKIPVEVDDESAKTSGRKAGQDAADEAKKAAATGFSAMPGLIAAGLLVGAPLIGGALVAGVGVGLAGLAGVVASRNQQVKDSFHELTNDLSNTADSWSTELGAPVSHAIGLVRGDFDKLAPQIHSALGNIKPEFSTLTGAVTDFADNAVPGMVRSTRTIGPVFDGVRSAAGSLGSSVGSLFDTMSQHSDSIGVSIASVGRVVQTLVNTAGPLIGTLSDQFAQHSGQIESALSAAGSTITGVASGALPMFGSALGADLTVVSGFLNAVGPADRVIGMFGGAALSAYTNVRLLSTLQGPLDSLSTKLKDAGTEGTTFGTMTSKAGDALGKLGNSLPYVGVALTGVGVIMDLAAQHGRDLAQAGQDAAKGLEAGGSAAAASRQQIAQWQQDAKTAQKTIDDLTAAGKQVLQTGGDFSADAADQTKQYTDQINDANTKVKTALDNYNKYTATLGAAALTQAEFTGQVRVYSGDAKSASSNTAQLKSAMDTMQSAASTADQKIQGLQSSLAILGDHGLQKAQDYAAQFGTALDGFTGQIDTAKGAVFNLNGELNTNSEKGRDVLKVLEDSQKSWSGQAQAMADAGKSQDAINAALQGNQDQLVGVLRAAHLTQPEIQTLLDKYGLLPKDISTQVNAPGAKQTQQDLQTISDKLKAIPPGQSVTMTSITADAEARLTSLGFHVTHMPDGSVTVSANTDPAWSATQSLIRDINGTRAVVRVDAVTGNTTSVNFGGGRVMSAHGNILKPFADGGFFDGHALTPMAAGVATMVPANTYRVVGDNMRVPEAYIPEDNSSRSRQLLAQTNADMGNPLGVGQSKTINIHNHITVRDNDTAHQVAALAGAGVAWSLQTARG